jgi:hypothetical protein
VSVGLALILQIVSKILNVLPGNMKLILILTNAWNPSDLNSASMAFYLSNDHFIKKVILEGKGEK